MSKFGSYLIPMALAFFAGVVSASALNQLDVNKAITKVLSSQTDVMGNVSGQQD